MGMLDTIRSALGVQKPLGVTPSDTSLQVTTAARARLDELPEGHGVHVSTSAVERGRVVRVEEGAAQGPSAPGLDVQLTASDCDLHHLRGLALDHRDGRWAVRVDLDVRARETPNPHGRLYLCSRLLLVGKPLFATPTSSSVPDLVARLIDISGVRSVLLRDNTATIEREPDRTWSDLDRGVDGALRHHFLLCGHEVDGSSHTLHDDPLEQAVQRVLEERILPGIHRDGGDLQLIGIHDGVVRVAMHGACRSCPASTATLKTGVEQTLKQAFPGQIHTVEQV